MMYHYFCSKDNLFLACAEKFFQDLLKYLSENIPLCSDGTPAQQLQKYFLCCEKYFRLHPESRRLYANLIISPPKHLKESIEKLRKPLRIMNSTFLQNVISHLSLYDNLRTEETLSYLSNVGRFFLEYNRAISGK